MGLAPRYIDVYALDVSAPAKRVVVPEDHPTIGVHHPSFLEEYLEPVFPWVVLLDEHKLIPEGRRNRLR